RPGSTIPRWARSRPRCANWWMRRSPASWPAIRWTDRMETALQDGGSPADLGTPKVNRGPERDTVLAALARAVAAAHDRNFLDFEGELCTFRQSDAVSRSFARAFGTFGIGQGDAVSSMLENNADCLHAWFAANMAGALWAPVNTALRRDFLASQLADTGSRL